MDDGAPKQLFWREFHHRRNTFSFDTFIFFPEGLGWRPEERIVTAAEAIYFEEEIVDDDTPLNLFRQGWRLALTMQEIRAACEDVWLGNGGADTLENFNRCLKHFLENDGFLFPGP